MNAAVEDMEATEDDEEKEVPRMEGYLEKKGKSRLVSSWRRYWFVLEGIRLTYYESQPHPSVELPPSCKGSLIIAPATSVTVSKPVPINATGHQPSYLEIYILNSSRLVTLRTKEAEHHALWAKALVASTKLPVKSPQTNGSKSPNSASTTSVFPLRPSTKYFRYSLTNLSSQEEKKAHWPKNAAHTMDSRSCSLYQRKSGSMDDMLDRYVDQTKELAKELNISDSDDEENEDLKSKAVPPEVEDHLIHRIPAEYSLPVIDHEIPPARLCESKEKDLVQAKERMEELSTLAIEDWDKIHPSSCVDENYVAENDLSRYIEITGHQSVKSSETNEGKVKARRFLTSLVSKDSKIFDGICRTDKMPKKERQLLQSSDKGLVSPSDKSEKPKVKHKQVSSQLDAKDRQNNSQRAEKTISLNDASQSGSSVRNSIMKRTSEFRTARREKRNKDKKKSVSEEVDSMDVLCERTFIRQNSHKEKVLTALPLLEESEVKKKRRKISFLAKMLRGKKSDGQEDVADRYGILEDLPIDNIYMTDKLNAAHSDELTDRDSSPQSILGKASQPPQLGLGLKLFLGDDAELKRKLESRMAQIESKMAMASDNGKFSGSEESRMLDGSNSPYAEGAGQMNVNLKSMEEAISSPPLVLSPRLIKLTPPTPPGHTSHENDDENLGDRSPDLLEGFLQGIASKDFQSSGYSSESNQGRGMKNEIILCEKGESGWKGVCQNVEESGCEQSAVTTPESISHLALHSNFGKERHGSEFESSARRTVRDSSGSWVHADYGTSDRGSHDTSPRMSWENSRDRDVNEPLPGAGISSVQRGQSNSLEPFQRPGSHVDELSFLLTELDRINSSPLPPDVSRPNHRPVSDEVKKVSTFEEDYITAYPIRRRRNSDPDYDIPRPHRIPHLRVTKEENRVDIMPSSTQQVERKSSSRENTDSIVIEATRFFGPGMDFSFNDKKYSLMKNNEDCWDYQYNCNDREMNCMSPDYFYGGDCERPLESKSGGENTVNEPSVPNASQVNSNEGVTRAEMSNIVDEKEDCPLRSKNTLELVEDGEGDGVVLRSSSVDRACRKERSREIFEEDFANQFKLNDMLDSLSISSSLKCTGESSVVQMEEGSLGQIPAALDHPPNENFTHGTQNEEVSPKSSQEFANVDALAMPELYNAIDTMSNGPASNKTLGLDTPTDSMTASAVEGAGNEKCLDENEVVLRSKPEGSSREDSKAYRLSFATTETLLVEEEVLVATLKTTTTTTTLLPLEDGSIHESRENVEEFVEEIVLDMDQLSDDQFDSMQVHSCVQT
ncbi:putative leucine-rich repeat-containing protein DDB_G0290503 isoform X2 [Hetaerina americana]|uniref:putative leucine-rich repeat-containing protein DDB_G0290503 isoform X2 n=1 Tax=Hetaerina americana TaxID=62018 RepID=UPI003A7F351D